MPTDSLQDPKFWNHVQKSDGDKCWIWNGTKTERGYGRFIPRFHSFGKPKRKMAHRIMWEYTHNVVLPPPSEIEVCHKCDNPSCVNPNHLFIATHKQNMADCKSKDRLNSVRGEKQGHAKLTQEEVMMIRKMYKPWVISYDMLGKMLELAREQSCLSSSVETGSMFLNLILTDFIRV